MRKTRKIPDGCDKEQAKQYDREDAQDTNECEKTEAKPSEKKKKFLEARNQMEIR